MCIRDRRWWLQGSLNRRYVGNFFAVAMCHSPLVKTLVMGLTMFAIPLLMARLAARGEERSLLPIYLASSAGLLLMPPVMWQETYAWVSGFGNYVAVSYTHLFHLLEIKAPPWDGTPDRLSGLPSRRRYRSR